MKNNFIFLLFLCVSAFISCKKESDKESDKELTSKDIAGFYGGYWDSENEIPIAYHFKSDGFLTVYEDVDSAVDTLNAETKGYGTWEFENNKINGIYSYSDRSNLTIKLTISESRLELNGYWNSDGDNYTDPYNALKLYKK